MALVHYQQSWRHPSKNLLKNRNFGGTMWPIWHAKRHSKMTDVPPLCSSCGKTEAVVYWSRVKVEDHDQLDSTITCSSSDTDLNERLVCNECRSASTASHGNGRTSVSSGNMCTDAQVDGSTLDADAPSGQVLLRKSRRASKAVNVKQRPPTSSSSSILQGASKCATPKGKSRRTLFKKSATKAPAAVATVVTTGSIFHRGIYYQIGDVVSMIDVKGGVYYAQIRGLLQDQYCEKSAVITWLLPTENSPDPETGFDANTYIIGPEEDIPRRLDCMDFVCHAPSEYFKAKNSPYPTVTQTKPELGFIWTRLRPQIRLIHDKRDNLFESGS